MAPGDEPKTSALNPGKLSICKAPASAPSSHCYYADDLIVVRARDGTETKDYSIPRKLLAWHSSYFAAATDPDGGFSNSGTKILELECSHKVFDAFHCWMYTGQLQDSPGMDAPTAEHNMSWWLLCDIWLFADFRGIPSLGNSAIDLLHERFAVKWRTVSPAIKHIYDRTLPGSKLRSFISEWYGLAYSLDEFTKQSIMDDQTVEFLHDVYPMLLGGGAVQHMSRTQMTSMDRCRWHDHSGPGGRLRLNSKK